MVDEFNLVKVYNAGIDLYEQERYAEAEPFFYRAYALNPFSPLLTFTLSQVFHRQSKWKLCEDMARETLVLQPDHSDARCNLGLALLYQNRFIDAAPELSAALAADPDNAEYINAMALCLYYDADRPYAGKTTCQLGDLSGNEAGAHSGPARH